MAENAGAVHTEFTASTLEFRKEMGRGKEAAAAFAAGVKKGMEQGRKSAKGTSGELKSTLDQLKDIKATLTAGVGFYVLQQAASAAAGALREMARAATDVIQVGSEFDRSIRLIATLSEESAAAIGSTEDAVLREAIRNAQALDQVTGATFDVISALGKVEGAQEATAAAGDLAVAGHAKLSSTMTALTRTLGAYDLELAKSARIADMAFQAQAGGQVTIEGLAKVLPRVASLASGAGLAVEEMFGALAVGSQREEIDQAATGLAGLFAKVAGATEEVKAKSRAMADAMGESFEFSAQHMKRVGLLEFMRQLGRVTEEDASKLRQLQIDQSSLTVTMALMKDNAAGLAKQIDAVADSEGAAARAAEDMRKSTAFQLERMQSAFDTFKVVLFRELLEPWTGKLHEIEELYPLVRESAKLAARAIEVAMREALIVSSAFAAVLGRIARALVDTVRLGNMLTPMGELVGDDLKAMSDSLAAFSEGAEDIVRDQFPKFLGASMELGKAWGGVAAEIERAERAASRVKSPTGGAPSTSTSGGSSFGGEVGGGSAGSSVGPGAGVDEASQQRALALLAEIESEVARAQRRLTDVGLDATGQLLRDEARLHFERLTQIDEVGRATTKFNELRAQEERRHASVVKAIEEQAAADRAQIAKQADADAANRRAAEIEDLAATARAARDQAQRALEETQFNISLLGLSDLDRETAEIQRHAEEQLQVIRAQRAEALRIEEEHADARISILEDLKAREDAILAARDAQLNSKPKAPPEADPADFFGGMQAGAKQLEDRLLTLYEMGEQTALSLGDNLAGALNDLATGAKSAGEAFKAFAAGVIQDLLRMITQQIAYKAVSSAIGLASFATGGSFVVGGTGGPDSKMVSFMATPGERVSIDPPGGRRGAANERGGGGASVVVNVHNNASGVEASARASEGPTGPQIDVLIERVVVGDLERGGKISQTLDRTRGGRRRGRRN